MSRERQIDLSERRVLILGAQGMLAGDLVPRARQRFAETLLADIRADESKRVIGCDLTEASQIRDLLGQVRPDIVINCAAYTAVDKAETDYAPAFLVNAEALSSLGQAARELGVFVVHISTDYVFGGTQRRREQREPLSEESPVAPCGIYGHSKHYGEEMLRQYLPLNHLLVRTSWLHGIHGPNFVDTMLRLGVERNSLKVVNDQFGSPTWTGWLADTLIRLLQRDGRGTFHASSRGGISWFDFAREIFRQAGMPVEVLPQSTEELNRPAPRPAYSVLDVSKLERLLGEVCMSWQDCVRQHLAARGMRGGGAGTSVPSERRPGS